MHSYNPFTLSTFVFITSLIARESQIYGKIIPSDSIQTGNSVLHDIPEGLVSSPWPKGKYNFGQVSGITVDDDDLVYVFHRVDRVWDINTFDNNNIFVQQALGPINDFTILIFHSNGTFIKSRGKGMFYIPHGITVDKSKNIWLTDVALHQVMKMSPSSDNPILTLGEPFTPGTDSAHFCKPTSVAITSTNGDFFVADGYCNSRILKYNAKGVKILEWGRNTVQPGFMTLEDYNQLNVPHALTLVENEELICVADRENGRILCYNMNNSTFVRNISNPLFGPRIFSLTYSPAKGGKLFLVNGRTYFNLQTKVEGFIVNLYGDIIAKFGPSLENPHDIAVSTDGSSVYVGEISPYRVWKFIPNGTLEIIDDKSFKKVVIPSVSSDGQLTGVFLLTVSCIIFAIAIVIAACIYSKTKQAGTPDSLELLPKHG